jgi:Deoxyribonuclease II
MPMFFNWLSGVKTTDTSRVSSFTSLGGLDYYQFSKSGNWGKDLYDDLIAPYLEAGLNVETWRNGAGGRMSSICGQGPKVSH